MESLEVAERMLVEWIRTVTDAIPVEHTLPAEGSTATAIHAYLLAIEGGGEPNDSRRARRRHTLRYFVTAVAQEPRGVRDEIGKLLIAASDMPELECAAVRYDEPLWLSLGIRPRPALRVGVPWFVERKVELAPAVAQDLALRFTGLRNLEGVVHGPDGAGIARARVRVPMLGRSAVTDDTGRFHIEGVASGTPLRLEIAARGHVAHVDARFDDDDPLLRIRIDPQST